MYYIKKLKEMFAEMVVKKDASLIPLYYHPDFLLYTNGQATDYQSFLTSHIEYYASEREYNVEYGEATLLEQGDKIAGRIWIIIKQPGHTLKKIEVILIVQYNENKIYRLWELTYPDWSKLAEFHNHSIN